MFRHCPSLVLHCLLVAAVGACTSSRGDVFVSEGEPPRSSDCGTAIYCSDFETPPDGLNSAAGGEIVLVDSLAHGGQQSLRASVAGVDDWARLDIALPNLRQVGLRAWISLDASAADLSASDVYVLIALHPAPELGEGGLNKVSVDLETGFQPVLVETVESASKIRSGFELGRGRWHCLRMSVAGEPGQEQVTLELDGQTVAMTEGEATSVPPGGFQSLFLGIEYSLGATPLMYYDDVVVDEVAPACDE